MTGKSDFTEEEWKTVLEAPPSAGLLVIASDRAARSGRARWRRRTPRLARITATASCSTRSSAPSRRPTTPVPLAEELKKGTRKHITDAVELLNAKATPEEVEEYKKFILGLANRVAEARKEGFMGLSGERVSGDETAAIQEIEAALG
jgi:hypothetical protein